MVCNGVLSGSCDLEDYCPGDSALCPRIILLFFFSFVYMHFILKEGCFDLSSDF